MTKQKKEQLNELSKEQLIYIIEKLDHSLNLINDICEDEFEWQVNSKRAIGKIRGHIHSIPDLYTSVKTNAYLDMKMKKISSEEYEKIIGLDCN